MVLDTSVSKVFDFVGHNGGDLVFDVKFGEPYCRRGFSLYEMTHFALHKGYGVTPMSPRYTHESIKTGEKIEVYVNPTVIDEMYGQEDMVLVGTMPDGCGHAVAWSVAEQAILDPNGVRHTRQNHDMSVEIMLLCSRLKWPLLLSSKHASG